MAAEAQLMPDRRGGGHSFQMPLDPLKDAPNGCRPQRLGEDVGVEQEVDAHSATLRPG
jgi:hypothetical protein